MSTPEEPPPYGALPPPTPYRPGLPMRRAHNGATTALVLGVLGLMAVPLGLATYIGFAGAICSPLAIWLGVRSGREIDADPEAWSNRGMATAGYWTGIVGLALNVLAIIALVVLVVVVIAVLAGAG